MNTIRRILDILTPHERRRLWLVFAGVLASALLEVVGIASILPFLTLVANPDAIQSNSYLSWLFTEFGFSSDNRFMLFLGILTLGALTLSNTMRAVVTWGMLRFSWMRNHSLSRRLLENYMHRPYVFFLNENTARLGRNILSETGNVINGILIPGIEMIARAVVLLFIMVFLIAINPVLALVLAFSLGAVYGVIYLFMRRKLARIGKERMEANAMRFKTANEAFGGIKAIKLMGGEETFIKRYSIHSLQFSKHMATASVLSRVPHYALETVAYGGIILLVIYLLATQGDLGQVLPLAGLYMLAGYRMMPAMKQLFQGATKVRFNIAVLDTLYEALRSGATTQAHCDNSRNIIEPLSLKNRLELDSITFYYPGVESPVIPKLSLNVEAGSSIAFAGKTGAGKTTICDIILGLLSPSEGTIRVDGVELVPENMRQWQRNLGYVPQEIYLQDDTIASNIAFGSIEGKIDVDAVEQAARIANIHDFIINKLPQGYDTLVGERGVRLSGGERQRIGIARALYHDPAVLVLDEATSALDGATEQAVFKAIENVAMVKTLIIIAHRLTTVRKCDVIYVIDDGSIVGQGTYNELMASSAKFQEMAKAHL